MGAYAGLPDALVVRAQGVRRPGGVEEVPFGEVRGLGRVSYPNLDYNISKYDF